MSLSRRQILRGAFGASLALPFLPSLFGGEKEAKAAYTTRKFFVSMQTEHGCAWGKNMFPADSTLTEKRTYVGHEIRSGALVPGPAPNGKTALCPILTATALTKSLTDKMIVMRGLDVPYYVGHNTGVALGNYARNDSDANGVLPDQPRIPTIDQLMAWSPNFYSDLSSIRERSVIAAPNTSWNYSNPQTRSGPVQAIGSTFDSAELMKRIYVTNDPTGRKPIADLVLEDYKRTRNASGISKDDQRRLDDHMQRISELQRRLNVRASCSNVKVPTGKSTDFISKPGYGVNEALEASAWQLLNDVIVAAFMCGTSRIAIMRPIVQFSNYAGASWHQDVAHQAHMPDGLKQKIMSDSYQFFFEQVFLDLAIKLDAVSDGAGRTLLDNSLVMWSQESGAYAHNSQSLPIVAAGSAGSYLKTGLYCDYRNLFEQVNPGGQDGATEITHAGIMQAQWLGTILQAMGLERNEYETTPSGGYGIENLKPEWAGHYPAAVMAARKELLPFLK